MRQWLLLGILGVVVGQQPVNIGVGQYCPSSSWFNGFNYPSLGQPVYLPDTYWILFPDANHMYSCYLYEPVCSGEAYPYCPWARGTSCYNAGRYNCGSYPNCISSPYYGRYLGCPAEYDVTCLAGCKAAASCTIAPINSYFTGPSPVVGSDACPWSCNANSTYNGSACVCDTGFYQLGSRCVSYANTTALGSACSQASCVAQGQFPCSSNYFYVNNDWVISNTAVCGYDFSGNVNPTPDSFMRVYTPSAISATLTLSGYIDIYYYETLLAVSTIDPYPTWWSIDVFDTGNIVTNMIDCISNCNVVTSCTSNCNGAPYGYFDTISQSYFKINYTVTIPRNTFYLNFATGDGGDTNSWLNVSYFWTLSCIPCPANQYASNCSISSVGSCVSCPVNTVSSMFSVGVTSCKSITTAMPTTATTCLAGAFFNATRCSNCTLGTYSNSSTATACTTCAVNTYVNVTGATACVSCVMCNAGLFRKGCGAESPGTCSICNNTT